MSGPDDPLLLAARLSQQGEAYALATVVRVLRPASARRADRALVTPDRVWEAIQAAQSGGGGS